MGGAGAKLRLVDLVEEADALRRDIGLQQPDGVVEAVRAALAEDAVGGRRGDGGGERRLGCRDAGSGEHRGSEVGAKGPASAAKLTVTVEDVRSDKGAVMAGLYDRDGRRIGEASVPAMKGSVTLTFAGLADGAYAVRLYHDENGNGQLDTKMFGIPREGVGFSNRAVGRFGPPSFAESGVEVAGEAATAARLKY